MKKKRRDISWYPWHYRTMARRKGRCFITTGCSAALLCWRLLKLSGLYQREKRGEIIWIPGDKILCWKHELQPSSLAAKRYYEINWHIAASGQHKPTGKKKEKKNVFLKVLIWLLCWYINMKRWGVCRESCAWLGSVCDAGPVWTKAQNALRESQDGALQLSYFLKTCSMANYHYIAEAYNLGAISGILAHIKQEFYIILLSCSLELHTVQLRQSPPRWDCKHSVAFSLLSVIFW